MYSKLYSNDSYINPLGQPITMEEDGWIGSLVNIGAAVGTFPFGFIAERFGRKITLLLIGIPHVICFITMAFAENIYLLYFGRLFGGLAVGGGYAIMPIYLAEVADESKRGLYSTTLGIFWNFGNFLPYAIGPFLSAMWFNLILAVLPVTFCVIFISFGTETPYHLVAVDKVEEARELLMLLRGKDKSGVEEELVHVQSVVKNEEQGHFSDILTNSGLRKAFLISVAMIVLLQMSGLYAIAFYQQPIYEAAGTKITPEISSLVSGAFLFLCGFIMPAIVNKFNRRTLFTISTSASAVSLMVIGTFFYLKDVAKVDTRPLYWLPITGMFMYTFSMGLGFGMLPWTISSELFPKSVKQIALSVLSSICFCCAFLVTKFFNDMKLCLGSGGIFWFFSAVCALTAVFGLLWIPETRGKNFIEIQAMLQSDRKTLEDEIVM